MQTIAFSALLVLLGAASTAIVAPAAAAQTTPAAPARPELPTTPAESEWLAITDEITPKLVRWKSLSEEERKKETFATELRRVGDFVRKYEKVESDVADRARIFLALELLSKALERDGEAIDVLRDVALHGTNAATAGVAAVDAGQILLRLGDEARLKELHHRYSERADHDALVVEALAQFWRRVRLQPGRPFPDLALTDLSGQRLDLQSLHGKLVVIVVFNVEHAASLERFEEVARVMARGDPNVAAVGISLDRERTKLLKEIDRLKVAFPIDCSGKEWNGPSVKELGLSSIPALFVLDPDGKIVIARLGSEGGDLAARIDAELKRARANGRLPALPPGH